MAASEDEGGQSDNKNDDPALQETSKQFSTIHQEIESQLERPGVSYEARVSAVISGWERLAGFVHGDISQMQPLATYLYRWSLRLVLQGQWPGLAQIVKTRLGVTLQRCSKVPVLEPLCRTLLPLVSDPWGHQTKTILSEAEITDEEAINYVTNETWEVVRVRVDTMVESKCEKLAKNVLKVCVRCIHLQSEGMVVPLYTDEDHNHFVDLYFVLLHKFERTEFVEEVKKLNINEGVELVRRLVGKQDKLKVWKHRLKIADLAIQIFLATTIVKKYSHDFDLVFHEWCSVQQALSVEDTVITATIRKYIALSESSKHVYAMARVLHEKSGSYLASLVTELLIRALTTDMNSLEALKLKTDKDSLKEDQLYLEHQMATGFMDLGAVFNQHKNVARECILTAFSLHPTSARLSLLSSYVTEPSPPHPPAEDASVCRNVSEEELQEMGLAGTSLSPLRSTDLYAHSETLNGVSSCSPLPTSPYHCSSTPCNDSIDQDSATQAEVEQVKSNIHVCGGDNSVNNSDMVRAQECEKFHDVESQFADGLQISDDSSQQNESRYTPCTSQPKDPPPKDECVVDITIDTGQTELSVIHRQDSVDPQISRLSSDAQVTESVSLTYTKESEDDRPEVPCGATANENSVQVDARSKEDIDSMDTFYKSTENFIQQLQEEPPKKSPPQTSGETYKNYDILTQPNQVLDSQELGLPKELCDDLAVVLSSPRWQVLSWVLDRHELLGICERYLHDADSAKNLTKELKYLNIDYSLFKHMPSAEVTEFTGIEKGYEHFIEYESESEYSGGEHQVSEIKRNVESDISEIGKKKKRKDDIKKAKMYDTCSDPHGRFKGSSRYVSYSDSEDSDVDPRNKTLLLKMDHDGSRIEGKRVTAFSSLDRSKRIRIDAGTGKIRRDRVDIERSKVRHERNLMNTLRLFRHKKYKEPKVESKFSVLPKSPSCYAPRLSSLNVHPKVVLTERDVSVTRDQIQSGVTTVIAGSKRPAPTCSIPSSQSQGSWIYAGSLVAPPNSANSTRAVTPISIPRSSAATVQCYLRSKDGKVRMAPLNRALLNNARPANPVGGNTEKKALHTPTSGYLDSYTKFLQNNKKSSVTLVRKNMTLDASLDYLEKQGTTVTFKSHKGSSTLALANAQKNVLNRIMSPENALTAMRDRFNERLPVRAIAMPVSNNVPNMPTDKSSPANLSRVLPKGTTVVRKPKADGAGPSGLNNGGGPSGGAVSPRAVISRPGGFSAVVARPSISVSNASMRTTNSVMTVRNSSSTIRTPVSREIVASGSSGTTETTTNSSSSLPVSSSVVTSAAAVGSVTTAMPAPLVSATVVGSVPSTNNLSSPMGTLGGSNGQQPWENALDDSVSDSSPTDCSVALTQNMSSTRGATTCTTTVASPPGDVRAASMLETLLRDRPIPASPLQSPSTTATTTITAALPQTLTSIVGGTSIPITVSGEGQVTSAVMGALGNTGNSGNSVVIAGGSNSNSGVIVASGMVGGTAGSGVVVASGGVVGNTGVVTAGNNSLGGGDGGTAVQQVLVPGQLVQVHTSDGSTGLGIVHSSSLDLRLPAGTRVIKSSSGPVRTTASQQHQVMGVINQAAGRQVNVLHNVKILQNVQNRQIVRTVVVPHSVAVQGLGSHQASHLKPQLVALSSQGTSTATSPTGGTAEATIVQAQGPAGTVRAKIPSSTIVQKVLGRGGLVIRTLRPQTPANQVTGETSAFEEGLGAKLQQQQQQTVEDDKSSGTTATTVVTRLPQDEGLGERLSHYLKTALVSSTSTQSVGTQTLTTAVKPSAGQCVTQVAMNHLRGGTNAVVTLGGGVQGIAGQSSSTASTSPSSSSQQSGLSSLPLTPSNAVSSETLEQLREFESVFEKVSNKSGKDAGEGEVNAESYSGATISSEESMIAAQLLSMANDTPAVTTSSNYVYSVPASMHEAGSARLTEGTYITIPSTTQAGSTLILVNHSGGGTGLVTVAGGVQGQHPPSAPSPTLSSTSSHSSIASSPSSTSSKNKKQPPKPKVVPPTTPPSVTKPKTPPPPKTPAPKPSVAKPQVEESDETKARIQAILEQYKQELAITPQPQPAPRNRKNCPPPKSDGKSSNKKKSGVKKVEGSAGNSPAVSEGSIAGCPSPSPSPGPASDSSVGLSGNSTGVGSIQYTGQSLTSQGTGTTTGTIITEEKVKSENNIKVETGQEVVAGPQLLQGVMVSNVKVEGASVTGTTTNLPQTLAGGRVVQLIRHGGKVTAITTRQPLNKIKTSGQSGPPPNVTIQGRINMNDLMESHIASLLTGGSPTITQSPTVVSKIIQQQATGHPTVQQVVVQPSSAGPQVLQQVSVQQIPSTPTKAHQQQKCGVIQQLASGEELLGLTTPPRSLHVNLPALSTTVLNATTSVASTVTVTNTQTIVNSPVIMNASGNTSGPSPLSVPPSSPLTPQTHPVTSPNQPVSASPHTLSPANEQPPTPTSFQMGEESNSSEQSVGEGAGPLPPFFTLKSFIMQPAQQKQRPQNQQSQQEQQTGHDKNFSPTTASEQTFTPTVTPAVSSVINSPVNKPQRGNQTHVHLHHNQHPRKPASVIRTGGASGRILVGGTGEGNGKSASHSVTSPLLTSGTGDPSVPLSPMSGPSSLESSPATTQSRIRLASRPQDMRSSSIDSLKSDLSVEEVQIPPSPATLTKQLQNAYMTEAALSPSVSQSQHSGSSYSSPGTTHDLPFTEAPPTSEDSFPATLSQPGCSSAPSAPGLSVTGVTLESDSGLAALTSPSGDIYLHQSGSSLGLEGLEAATLPLVAGMEVRTHSPLSDLVSSGPLLTWSPRSADSMMAQSPSLNDALTANIPLDGNHSEDSLCDSSTGFPGLFSIEGDGVSVSSSTSEDIPSAPLGTSSGNQQQQECQESVEVTIDLTPQESEQDHTITSTRSPTQLELPVANLRTVTGKRNENSVGILASPTSEDTPWRFENTLDNQNAHHSPNIHCGHNEKAAIKQEDGAGPSDTVQGKIKSSTSSRSLDKKRKLKEQFEDDKIASEVIQNQTINKGKRDINKKIDRNEVKRNSTVSEGNKKRSHRLASLLEGRKSSHQNESDVVADEVSTKNGHDEGTNVTKIKSEDSNGATAKNKRRSSQRTTVVYPGNVQSTACRNRSKLVKSEDVKKEESDVMETFIKEEKPSIKNEGDCKEGCEDAILRLQEGCEETLGRTTRGSKRRSEGDAIADLKRGRGTRSGRRSEGDMIKTEDEIVNHLEEECTLSRTLRGRHVSGASDTSSNYSMERALTPGPHDFPSGINSNSSRRRRRLSRESSASSRDGSPTLLHTHDFSPGGVNTRRSSSRDHAKKKKCSCCVGGDFKKKSGLGSSNSNRRSSSRATRASHSGTLQ